VFLPDATAEVVYLDRGVAFTLAESSENDVRIGIARYSGRPTRKVG